MIFSKMRHNVQMINVKNDKVRVIVELNKDRDEMTWNPNLYLSDDCI